MKTLLLAICIFFFTLPNFAQNEASNWYFGRFAGLDFRNGSPMLLTDGKIQTNEGCSSISDSDGNLLFYTNGVKVWNKNHNIMVNGDGLKGHWSSSNSSVVIPKPNSKNIYYLVTLDEPNDLTAAYYPNSDPNPRNLDPFDLTTDSDDGLNNGLNYSIIDMSLNGGEGEVVSKNIHLITYNPSDTEQKKYKCSEKLTAVYNSDGTAIWFLTHFIDKFYVFKIDNTGINTTPVISPSIFTIPINGYLNNAIGCIKFSPDGNKLAIANTYIGTDSKTQYPGNAYLFNFDNNTGSVSSGIKIMDGDHPYGLEFSPSSQVLYINTNKYNSLTSDLYQFDLTASDISNSKYRAWGAIGAGALQLGIDGEIYISMPDSSSLSQVLNPNTYGSNVDITWYNIDLEGFNPPYRKSFFGLPTFIQSNFEQNITFEDLCLGSDAKFNLINYSSVDSVTWSFGDEISGAANQSTDLKPVYVFVTAGTYEITASVKSTTGTTRIIKRKLEITELPTAHPISDIYVCAEDNSSYSNWVSSFPTSHLEKEVLRDQKNMIITYYGAYGSPIYNISNTSVFGQETIKVRVASKNNPTCFSETIFKVIVVDGAKAFPIDDIYACDNDGDGFAEFDLSKVKGMIAGSQTNMTVTIFDENNNLINLSATGTYINTVPLKQILKARISDENANCYQEKNFNLLTSPQPIAHSLTTLIGCDDNNDGISEYFDTSNIESDVLGNQTGMKITYFDSTGNQLANPLPNPYTNSIANQETITVRVTNPQTNCYTETFLNLVTSAKPMINQPKTLYGCDEGNGFGNFDTSTIENQLIGNQESLLISYSDQNGNILPSPLPLSFKNTIGWSQIIKVRVESKLNPLCYSETSFNLIVNELPKINIKDEYNLCDLEPFLYLATDSNFDSWKWTFENGTVISNSFEANLIDSGIYTLRVSKISNGISCENSFSFNLIRSILPKISEVKTQDLSDNNYIEIITAGNGDFEYSIDGFNFQDNNTFYNILGGVYDVQVRDKKGCGGDKREIVLVDYPKFFTPNNDGYNEYWHILAIEKFPNSVTTIFDRYGKLVKRLMYNDIGWNGTFNGEKLLASDYWFTVELGNGKNFKGHFSLKR
ncbi:T9SS type B sorting domain-containing protein [Flavobacterium algoritolerans]|uniref:T9SS type B sorting domain-containing protein n=1 Tax=Flavobacterium algoritolerans TaxID=3041254 RepID=A0ABT6V9T9_9FLAO|nr:T9SS type B sorting domain-containing protein [Flavobacterium algoritolerans]MDI5894560.1 T9SS type B sorting domain-containing protein [Flavobacterium algoritolerans]